MPLITAHDLEWAASILAERPEQLLVTRLVEVNRQTPGSYTSNADELARLAGRIAGYPTGVTCRDTLARIIERHRARVWIPPRAKTTTKDDADKGAFQP